MIQRSTLLLWHAFHEIRHVIDDLSTYVGELATFTSDEIQLGRVGPHHPSSAMSFHDIAPSSLQWCNEFRYRSLSSREQRGSRRCRNFFGPDMILGNKNEGSHFV